MPAQTFYIPENDDNSRGKIARSRTIYVYSYMDVQRVSKDYLQEIFTKLVS